MFPVSFTILPMPLLALINNSFLDDLFLSHPFRVGNAAQRKTPEFFTDGAIFHLCALLRFSQPIIRVIFASKKIPIYEALGAQASQPAQLHSPTHTARRAYK